MFFVQSYRRFILILLCMGTLSTTIPSKSDWADVATVTLLSSSAWGLLKLGKKVYNALANKNDNNNTTPPETSENTNTEQPSISHTTSLRTIRDRYYAYLESKPWGSACKKHIEALKQEENALMQEFFALANITEQEFKDCKKKWHKQFADAYKQRDDHLPRIDNHYSRLFQRNLAKVGIPDSYLEFRESINDPRDPYAAAAFKTIYINLKNISKCRTIEIAIVAFHELMHIIHQDRLNTLTMEALLQNKHPYFAAKYGRFKERRADILALLIKPKLAQYTAQWYADDQEVSTYSNALYHDMVGATAA